MSEISSSPQPFLLDKIQLRFLGPADITALKSLCRDWFPIEYPEGWYRDVTQSQKYFSLAATLNQEVIGVIIAEVKQRWRCNTEDSNILGYWYSSDIKVAYILILGVKKGYRRSGVASLLLDNFLAQLTSEGSHECKAVYLHVLSSNESAVKFYEHRNFTFHRTLLNYYNINGARLDGFCYVLYINGGKPPWSLLECLKNFAGCVSGKCFVCASVRWICRMCVLPCGVMQAYSKGLRNM